MLNRLLESWLDSASERSYQSAFCQILSARGHTVLHSTRHGPLELGKDILTIGPDGIPCAFQLKGNPSSRLTLNQFREIQSQIIQLVSLPVNLPGMKVQPHKTYLVTNGYIEEEVRVAVDGLNQSFIAQRYIGKPVVLIARGQLLKWAIDLGSSLWPSEIEDLNHLLQLLVCQGNEIYPLDLLHNLLIPLLFLGDHPYNSLTANELKRRITSAALLTAASLQNFSLKENHFATISAWVIFCCYSIAACEKFNKSYKRNAGKAVEIALEEIFVSLSNLCNELAEKKHYIEGDSHADVFTYHGRYTLLIALMSLYWFWCKEKG